MEKKEKKEKVSCISRNYQLIIYVYAAVEAPRAYLPLSLFVDGALCAEYYDTFLRACESARVASRARGRRGKGASECPLFTLYILKVLPPITLRRRNLQPFSHVSERGG